MIAVFSAGSIFAQNQHLKMQRSLGRDDLILEH